MKELKRIIKKFRSYDQVYYDNKLTEVIIICICLWTIACFILACILWEVI